MRQNKEAKEVTDSDMEEVREMTGEEINEILKSGLIINCESEEVMNEILDEFREAGVEAYRTYDDEVGEYVVEMPPVRTR